MDDIMREKLNIGSTLNFNETLMTLQAVPKQEIWHTHINKSMIFNAL